MNIMSRRVSPEVRERALGWGVSRRRRKTPVLLSQACRPYGRPPPDGLRMPGRVFSGRACRGAGTGWTG